MKPGLPKGTRDFGPEEVRRRDFIFDTLRRVFRRYGFQPLETPSLENLSTLTGKYGEEGDKLLFKVLNNGDFLRKADKEALAAGDAQALAPSIARRGMRYDLTVPFARYVVMHQHELTFPFKRYQIQPVWRADRPQRGRYQEFYQCDVDVVGTDGLVCEAELAQIYDEAFHQLGLSVKIRLNNRKILAGMAERAGVADRFVPMTIAIDKLDKIGIEGVRRELASAGIDEAATSLIERMLAVDELDQLEPFFADSEVGQKGIAELRGIFGYLQYYENQNDIRFDVTLARGLDYYTGCIFEVGLDPEAYPEVRMGSLGGGGRYDDLTGVFGLKNVSGVGVSFGAERIYDVLEELEAWPDLQADRLRAVFVAFDEESHRYAYKCLLQLRDAGINAEIYPEPIKIGKQLKYVDDREAPYAIIVGSEEMKSGRLALKHMRTGEQEALEMAALIARLKNA